MPLDENGAPAGLPQSRDILKMKFKFDKTKNLENLARIYRMFEPDGALSVDRLTLIIASLEADHAQKLAMLQMRNGGISGIIEGQSQRVENKDGETT